MTILVLALVTKLSEHFGMEMFLCIFLPEQTTEFTQLVDTGYGRSLRCALGEILDT